MLEKGGTAISAGRESNIVGHLMPQYEVSQHKLSEEKSWMEIYSPLGERKKLCLEILKWKPN